MDIPLEEMALWDWRAPAGSLGRVTPDALERSRIILWQGHCSVHQRFSLAQIEQARERYPDVQIVVHPECRSDVVQAEDASRPTASLSQYVHDAPAAPEHRYGT